jgi:hypothetical protein
VWYVLNQVIQVVQSGLVSAIRLYRLWFVLNAPEQVTVSVIGLS